MKVYDLIIIGGGPAAMSAAVYAARRKLKTALIAKQLGGQMNEGYVIENYLGPYGTPGPALAKKFIWHLNIFKKELEIKEGEKVQQISGCDSSVKIVETDREEYKTKTVIIATGKSEKKLDIPGAKEFEGKGITYCATCDAPMFSGKIVAVVGAGDSGIDTVHQLLSYTSKIYWLNKYAEIKGENKTLGEEMLNNGKVQYLPNCVPSEIKGEKFVKSLIYTNVQNNQKSEVEVEGIFVEIGSTSKVDFINGCLKTSEWGEIEINHQTGATSVPGIFAAGDVADTKYKQISIAVGQGAIAALSAADYLKTLNKK